MTTLMDLFNAFKITPHMDNSLKLLARTSQIQIIDSEANSIDRRPIVFAFNFLRQLAQLAVVQKSGVS